MLRVRFNCHSFRSQQNEEHCINSTQIKSLLHNFSVQIALIKVAAARMVCKVLDCAIQVFGAAGVSGDFPLAQM